MTNCWNFFAAGDKYLLIFHAMPSGRVQRGAETGMNVIFRCSSPGICGIKETPKFASTNPATVAISSPSKVIFG